jgi:hypothetical protein
MQITINRFIVGGLTVGCAERLIWIQLFRASRSNLRLRRAGRWTLFVSLSKLRV